MHALLDEGRAFCRPCGRLVPGGDFCGECGESLHPDTLAPVECPTKGCRTMTTTRFCPNCGERVMSETVEKINRGETTIADVATEAMRKFYANQRRKEAASDGER